MPMARRVWHSSELGIGRRLPRSKELDDRSVPESGVRMENRGNERERPDCPRHRLELVPMRRLTPIQPSAEPIASLIDNELLG